MRDFVFNLVWIRHGFCNFFQKQFAMPGAHSFHGHLHDGLGRSSTRCSNHWYLHKSDGILISEGFLPRLLTQEGGEGRGEEVVLLSCPSLRLSPHSFLAGRERT